MARIRVGVPSSSSRTVGMTLYMRTSVSGNMSSVEGIGEDDFLSIVFPGGDIVKRKLHVFRRSRS